MKMYIFCSKGNKTTTTKHCKTKS